MRGYQKMSDIMRKFDMLCGVAMTAYDEESEISYETSLLRVLNFVKCNLIYKKSLF